MSTRGVIGFRKNKKDKLAYNQCDSYPSSLGEAVLKVCKRTSVEVFNQAYDRIKFVTKKTLTPEVKNRLVEAEGKLEAYVEGTDTQNALEFMAKDNDFIKASLFCEWGYIVNLDNNTLEVWTGYQKEPTVGNRYGEIADGGFYPCKLIAEFPLDNLPTDLTTMQFYT